MFDDKIIKDDNLTQKEISKFWNKLFKILLSDKTTNKNIIWATDNYTRYGIHFQENDEIKREYIDGWIETTVQNRVDKDNEIKILRTRKKAEVFTPSWIVKKQVEVAMENFEKENIESFIKTKWLEITCGEAPYMANRYDMISGEYIELNNRSGFIDYKFRKIRELDKKTWLIYAIEIFKNSYGYEYQGDSLLIARKNLLLTFKDYYFEKFQEFPDSNIILKIADIISKNVIQMDGLSYEVPFSNLKDNLKQINIEEFLLEEQTIKKTLYAKIKNWDKNKFVEFRDISKGGDKKMKFDVVIGNPPYQATTNGDNNFASPIYNYFYEEAFKISDIVLLITPARFLFNSGGTPKEWNKKMLNDENLKVLTYKQKSAEVFQGTDIKGGIAILYRNSNKKFGAIKTFLSHEELNTILKKVINNKNFTNITGIIDIQSRFNLKNLYEDYPEYEKLIGSNGKDKRLRPNTMEKMPEIFTEDKIYPDSYKILGLIQKKRAYRYISKKYIENNVGGGA